MKQTTIISGAITTLLMTFASFAVAQDQDPAVALQVPETATLTLSNNSAEQEPGFLYFKQADPVETETGRDYEAFRNSITSFTPRANTDFMNLGAANAIAVDRFMFQGFTPRTSDTQMVISFDSLADTDEDHTLDITLSSSLRVEDSGLPGTMVSPALALALSAQAYEFGVSVGYAGFNIGANVSGTNNSFLQSNSGFDIGLGYVGESWSTRLQVGEYSVRYQNIYADKDQNNANFYALQWGASYRLSNVISLSGGFRYLTLNKDRSLGLWNQNQAQEFYLGTNVSF